MLLFKLSSQVQNNPQVRRSLSLAEHQFPLGWGLWTGTRDKNKKNTKVSYCWLKTRVDFPFRFGDWPGLHLFGSATNGFLLSVFQSEIFLFFFETLRFPTQVFLHTCLHCSDSTGLPSPGTVVFNRH